MDGPSLAVVPKPATALPVSYRFVWEPRWLVGHLLALVALAVMVLACFWQLSRLQDKQDRNRLYAERTLQPQVDVAAVVPPGAGPDQVAAARFRLLRAEGTYLVADEVFVRSRSLDGHPGAWVLTPLQLAADPALAVVVNRGWVPSSDTTPQLPAGADAPGGTVIVTGLALPGETRGALGSVDTVGPELEVLARVDLGRLQQQVEPQLLGVYLQLQAQAPATGETFPAVVPPPPPDEGSHRGYAGQWAIFAVLWLFGYPVLVRRAAQRRAQGLGRGEPGSAQPSDGVLFSAAEP